VTMHRDAADRDEMLLEAASVDALERKPLPTPEELLRMDPVYAKGRTLYEETVRELAFSALAGTRVPPPGLKSRLLARLASEQPPLQITPQAPFDVKPGVVAVRSALAEWSDAPVEGLSYKVLGRDAAQARTTRLLRVAPGSSYPNHRHGGLEEVFVLEGSVHVNGIVLKAGDYCRSEAGTEEVGTHSDDGALLLVISSDADEVGIEG